MTISGEVGGDDPLYLDDLQVGQHFTSKTHVVDAAQIKGFARALSYSAARASIAGSARAK
jgi:hypothetical protein